VITRKEGTGGPFFNAVSDAHVMVAQVLIILMSIGQMGIIYRVEV